VRLCPIGTPTLLPHRPSTSARAHLLWCQLHLPDAVDGMPLWHTRLLHGRECVPQQHGSLGVGYGIHRPGPCHESQHPLPPSLQTLQRRRCGVSAAPHAVEEEGVAEGFGEAVAEGDRFQLGSQASIADGSPQPFQCSSNNSLEQVNSRSLYKVVSPLRKPFRGHPLQLTQHLIGASPPTEQVLRPG